MSDTMNTLPAEIDTTALEQEIAKQAKLRRLQALVMLEESLKDAFVISQMSDTPLSQKLAFAQTSAKVGGVESRPEQQPTVGSGERFSITINLPQLQPKGGVAILDIEAKEKAHAA